MQPRTKLLHELDYAGGSPRRLRVRIVSALGRHRRLCVAAVVLSLLFAAATPFALIAHGRHRWEAQLAQDFGPRGDVEIRFSGFVLGGDDHLLGSGWGIRYRASLRGATDPADGADLYLMVHPHFLELYAPIY